jgi:hypothetical protein
MARGARKRGGNGGPRLVEDVPEVITGDPWRWQGTDDVFFHRSQIKPGVRLVFFGRINHGDVWRIHEIRSYATTPQGRLLTRKLEVVEHLSDEVVIVDQVTNRVRNLRFATLSYSACWRITR